MEKIEKEKMKDKCVSKEYKHEQYLKSTHLSYDHDMWGILHKRI